MSNPIKSELSREMSLFQVTMMGVGMMIGAGVFVGTGIGIGIAGPGGILLAFALNGLLAFLSVMTYAELGSALPKAGGGYSYVQESSGGFTAFMTGWISWFGHAVAGSLYAITFAKYTLHYLAGSAFFKNLGWNILSFEKALAVGLALFFIYVNYRGAKETGKTGAAIAIGQTIVLLLIGFGSFFFISRYPENVTKFTPFLTEGWSKVFIVMGFTLIGFEGYEVISHTAEEVKDARKNIPKGIFYAIMIVVTTYLLVAFAAIVGGGLSGGSLSEWFKSKGATGFAEAVGNLFPHGNLLVVLAAVFASTSALNATIFSSTRISFALGRDGYLPTSFKHISSKTRIPDVALLFSGIITVTVIVFLDVETVMAGASIFFIFLFNIVTFSGMKIRIERGHELEYGYIIPWFPIIPVLSIIGRTLIGVYLLDMAFWAYIISISWLLVGFSYYFFTPMKEREHKRADQPVPPLEQEMPKGRIMAAIDKQEYAGFLGELAKVFAESQQEGITLAKVIQIPYPTPIAAGKQFEKEAKKILNKAADSIQTKVPVQKYLRHAHNSAEGVIQSAKAINADLLLLGWKGYTQGQFFSMGSTLDPVIEKVPCNVVVVKPGKKIGQHKVKRILCPTKGKGPHGKLTWTLVHQLASFYGAEITILNVTPKSKIKQIPKTLKETDWGEHRGIRYQVRILQNRDPVSIIRKESKNYDLVVIGASEAPLFKRMLFGSRAQRIAKKCHCTVMMVRKNTGLRSWFRRWFL